jgi:hypothetical protein
VPNDLLSVFSGTQQKSSLSSAKQKTLDKKTLGKGIFLECFIFDTRQIVSLPNIFSTLDKDNLKIVF